MAALPAGVQYGLSSESSYKEDKELVFLKLTDSAWKAIEDFIRNNRDKLAKPKIQFLPGNEGKISIPAPATNGSPGEATFHFSINSNAEMEGPQGSFECVRSDGAKRLESCGPLPRRMRVQANDDSYVATKDRMARSVAAEQSKCTRVIKPNQTDIGRRVKVRSSHPLFSSGPAATDRLERAERLDRPDNRPERMERPDNRPERMERPENRPERIERPDNRPERMDRPDNRPDRMERPDNRPERMTLDNRPERTDNRPERMDRPDNRPERMDTRPERIDRPDRPERQERPDRLDRSDRPERVDRTPVGNAPRPQPQPAPQQNSQQPHRPTPNPDLSRRSIKERLIQLLALKPFKKPELYARLSSEGIKEKDRSNVNKILPSIGSLKDNCYHLRRHMWNDVNEDWPFYTEEEKRLLKRRKPQNLTPPLSSDSANSLSPRASPSGNKRPGGPITPTGASGEELPSKKQRISHYRRPSPPSSGYATTSSGERHASDNEDDRTVKKDNGYTLNFTTVKELCSSPVNKANGFRSSPPVEQTSITENITHPEPEPEPLEENLASEFALGPEENLAELEQIERQFPPITSSGTRRAYKNEFARLYTEYQSKYQRVADVAALFSGLKHQLKHSQPHSPHHQTIRQRILEEYTRVRNETGYLEERRRVHYLDRKLNHIKRMVHQYDQLRLKPERVTTASTTQAY